VLKLAWKIIMSIPGDINNRLKDSIIESSTTGQPGMVVVNPDGSPVFTPGAAAGIADNRKVVAAAGTREALASSTVCKKVLICAETDNTGVIVVGGSTVVATLATRKGIPLSPGDSVEISIDNLADVYIDSTVSGDGVTYIYFT
jgi:hypothetical protein